MARSTRNKDRRARQKQKRKEMENKIMKDLNNLSKEVQETEKVEEVTEEQAQVLQLEHDVGAWGGLNAEVQEVNIDDTIPVVDEPEVDIEVEMQQEEVKQEVVLEGVAKEIEDLANSISPEVIQKLEAGEDLDYEKLSLDDQYALVQINNLIVREAVKELGLVTDFDKKEVEYIISCINAILQLKFKPSMPASQRKKEAANNVDTLVFMVPELKDQDIDGLISIVNAQLNTDITREDIPSLLSAKVSDAEVKPELTWFTGSNVFMAGVAAGAVFNCFVKGISLNNVLVSTTLVAGGLMASKKIDEVTSDSSLKICAAGGIGAVAAIGGLTLTDKIFN